MILLNSVVERGLADLLPKRLGIGSINNITEISQTPAYLYYCTCRTKPTFIKRPSSTTTMKLSIAVIASILGFSQAFVVAPAARSTTTTQLAATAPLDRREALAKGGIAFLSAATVFVATPTPALAKKDYTPRFDDLKQIYILGSSLDKLVAKLSDPDTVEAGLEGVRMFNRDPKFYNGYARNYVLKLIEKGADSDPRTGYIRQASTLIGSIEAVLDGSSGLVDKEATDDAIKRVKKAQGLIGKFLAESGVKDEKIDAYIASH